MPSPTLTADPFTGESVFNLVSAGDDATKKMNLITWLSSPVATPGDASGGDPACAAYAQAVEEMDTFIDGCSFDELHDFVIRYIGLTEIVDGRITYLEPEKLASNPQDLTYGGALPYSDAALAALQEMNKRFPGVMSACNPPVTNPKAGKVCIGWQRKWRGSAPFNPVRNALAAAPPAAFGLVALDFDRDPETGLAAAIEILGEPAFETVSGTSGNKHVFWPIEGGPASAPVKGAERWPNACHAWGEVRGDNGYVCVYDPEAWLDGLNDLQQRLAMNQVSPITPDMLDIFLKEHPVPNKIRIRETFKKKQNRNEPTDRQTEVAAAYEAATGRALLLRAGQFEGPCPRPECDARDDGFYVTPDGGAYCRKCCPDGSDPEAVKRLYAALDLRWTPSSAGQSDDHLLLAERLWERLRGRAVHAGGLGWAEWAGTHWELLPERRSLARTEYFRMIKSWKKKARPRGALKSSTATGVIDILEGTFDLAGTRFAEWDAGPERDFLINVLNGTLNTETWELQPHRREDRFTECCDCEWTPDALDPDAVTTWENFIERTITDAAERKLLSEWFGYCMTGLDQPHHWMILHGAQRSGKSTLIEAIQGVMGSSIGKLPSRIMLRDHRGHDTDNAHFRGKRFVYSSEIDDVGTLNGAWIKEVTGDSVLCMRLMRENPTHFRRTAKLMLICNDVPDTGAFDGALRSRLMVLESGDTIAPEGRDPTLPRKLATPEVRAAIFAWAMDGLRRFLARGQFFDIPASVEARTDAAMSEFDPLLQFRADCLFREGGSFIPLKACHVLYDQWATENEEQSLTINQFGRRFRKLAGKPDLREHDGTRCRCWVGWRELREGDPLPESESSKVIPHYDPGDLDDPDAALGGTVIMLRPGEAPPF